MKNGGPAFARPFFENGSGMEWSLAQEGMSLRAYLVAHAPVPMEVAYKAWSANRPTNDPSEPGYRDSFMAWGINNAENRAAFFRFWAEMRGEYADAVISELQKDGDA
jgi:hypothetical protein